MPDIGLSAVLDEPRPTCGLALDRPRKGLVGDASRRAVAVAAYDDSELMVSVSGGTREASGGTREAFSHIDV
ncbi:hypothetical protein ACLOJK_028984 [Asimina triloba]